MSQFTAVGTYPVFTRDPASDAAMCQSELEAFAKLIKRATIMAFGTVMAGMAVVAMLPS